MSLSLPIRPRPGLRLAKLSLGPRLLATPPVGWKLVQKAADSKAPKFAQAYKDAAKAAQRTIDWGQVQKAFEINSQVTLDVALGYGLAALVADLERSIPDLEHETLVAGGNAEAKAYNEAGGFRAAKDAVGPLRFDLINPESVKWAKKRSSQLITGISEATRASIRQIIVRSFTEGLTVAEASRVIRPLIGLTPQSVTAVFNLREALEKAKPGSKLWAGKTPIRVPKGGATQEWMTRRSEQYSQRLLNQRATLIARTEVIAAANEGQRQLWAQAVGKGLLGWDQLRVWIVTPDDRLCQECASYGGSKTPLGEPFDNGYDGPPAHPGCRCSQGLTRGFGKTSKKIQPSVTPTALPFSTPIPSGVPQAIPSIGDLLFPKADFVSSKTTAMQMTISDAEGGARAFRPELLGKTIRSTLGDTAEAEALIREAVAIEQDIFRTLDVAKLEGYAVETRTQMVFSPYKSRVMVSTQGMREDGKYLGEISRRYWRDEAGKLNVSHSLFEVPEKYRGGLAGRMLTFSMDSYSRNGVREVLVHANIDTGGYAWARYGFRATSPKAFRAEVLSRLDIPTLESEIGAERVQAIIKDFAKVSDTEVTTWVANLPEGKIILGHSDWGGYINLSEDWGKRQAAILVEDGKKKILKKAGKLG